VLVLAVDTATPAVTAAVVDLNTGQPRAVRCAVDARRHAELLGPAIRDALAEAGTAPGELAAVVAGCGPGPFTGLRVGLVTAVAFADAAGIPLYGVCSLDAIAAASLPAGGLPVAGRPAAQPTGALPAVSPPDSGLAAAAHPAAALPAVSPPDGELPAAAHPAAVPPPARGDRLLVATDARRREVYWAAYVDGTRVRGPAVDRPAALAEWLPELGVTAMAGAGAELYAGVLGLPLRPPAHPDPVALALLAADRVRAGAPGEAPAPLYLRRPDAERPGAPKPVLQR
jgi:tRNA threonylcarbamoyl adenosine modification protein YeaZ